MSNLKGSLESISLMDVAQLLHANRKTGMLQVSSGRIHGVLYFSRGEVIHAETVSQRGEPAAFEILEWNTGQFEFLSTPIQIPASIRRTVPDLLMDSARLSDSRKRLHTLFPRLTAVPWPTQPMPALADGLKLFAEERRILPYFDGYRDFRDVMNVSNQNDVAVLQAACILKDAGRLELLEPDAHVAVVTLKTSLFRKGGYLELPKAMESQWTRMGPYAHGIRNLRVIWPEGPAVERVEFSASLPEHLMAVPRELMQAWNLAEGSHVHVRPAP